MSKPILNNIHTKELNILVDKYNINYTKNRIRSRKLISSITFNSTNFGKFIVVDKYGNQNMMETDEVDGTWIDVTLSDAEKDKITAIITQKIPAARNHLVHLAGLSSLSGYLTSIPGSASV